MSWHHLSTNRALTSLSVVKVWGNSVESSPYLSTSAVIWYNVTLSTQLDKLREVAIQFNLYLDGFQFWRPVYIISLLIKYRVNLFIQNVILMKREMLNVVTSINLNVCRPVGSQTLYNQWNYSCDCHGIIGKHVTLQSDNGKHWKSIVTTSGTLQKYQTLSTWCKEEEDIQIFR